MSNPYARPVALTGSDQLVYSGAAILAGYTVRETGGTNPVTLRLFDNTTGTGTLLAAVYVEAGKAADVTYPVGTFATIGIYADLVGSGTAEGSVKIQ